MLRIVNFLFVVYLFYRRQHNKLYIQLYFIKVVGGKGRKEANLNVPISEVNLIYLRHRISEYIPKCQKSYFLFHNEVNCNFILFTLYTF